MELKETLNKINYLKGELDGLKPLTPEQESKVMDKFRLDWNYHSNHLEGNSLTFGETKTLLLYGLAAQGKPTKDHREIEGHNEAITYILEMIQAGQPLTETTIRQLHQLILQKPYEINAETIDGKPTVKKIEIGRYKTQPNHVRTKTGELFKFAEPEDTPAQMQDLMKWFNKEKDNTNAHPLIFAGEFHYKFIRIHPFDDGNGRLARILMNYVLVLKGYPPLIIRNEDKDNYLHALQLADGSDFEFYFKFLGDQLIRSLEISIKGAKGEEISDSGDVDKEIVLLKEKIKKLESINDSDKKSKYSIIKIFKASIFPLLNFLFEQLNKIDDLYEKTEVRIMIRKKGQTFSNSFANKNDLLAFLQSYSEDADINEIIIFYDFKHFKGLKSGYFDDDIYINIIFQPERFLINPGRTKLKINRNYSENITKDEIVQISDDNLKACVNIIKQKIQNK